MNWEWWNLIIRTFNLSYIKKISLIFFYCSFFSSSKHQDETTLQKGWSHFYQSCCFLTIPFFSSSRWCQCVTNTDFRLEYEYKYICVKKIWQIKIYLGKKVLAHMNTNIFGSHILDKYKCEYFTKKGRIWIQIQLFRLIFAIGIQLWILWHTK